MKKLLLLSLSLLLCFTLSSCGGSHSISGEVVEAAPAALVLETDEGKRVAVLLEESIYVFGMDEIDGDDYKAAPHTGVRVFFSYQEPAGSITTADGQQVDAYHADRTIHINAYLVPGAAVLSDGTILDAWKEGPSDLTYQTRDGVTLLRENGPNGPENYYIAGLESFDDLSEAAKPKVAGYYEQQGALYDIQAELERAWTVYQGDAETFSPFVVRQDTSPSASGEQIFYFRTDLTTTIRGNTVEETTLCAAFDRETGDDIPLEDLFTCPKEDIGRILLDLAEKDGTGLSAPSLKAEMEAAFQLEYLYFSQDHLMLQFPQGTLPSQEHTHLVSVKFNDDCKQILHPWAVPSLITQ